MADTRTSLKELAARVGELSSALAQSDGISGGGQRSQAYGNSSTIEEEMSHLFRPRNAMPTVEETTRPTGRPTAMNSSSTALSHQTIPPIYSVRRNFGGRSVPRRKQRPTPKRLVMQGPFLRDLVLLPGPNDDLIPRQSMKLWLSEHGHVMSGIELQKQWTSEQVIDCLRNAFQDKITDLTTLEILMSVHTKLLPPTIAPGQSLNGMIVFRIFKEKPIYVRPSEVLLLNPPNKKSKFDACDTDYEDADEHELQPAFNFPQTHFCPSDNQASSPGSSHITDDFQVCGEGIAVDTTGVNHSAQNQPDLASMSRALIDTSVPMGSTIQASPVIDLTEEYNALLNINLSEDDDEIEHLLVNDSNSQVSSMYVCMYHLPH